LGQNYWNNHVENEDRRVESWKKVSKTFDHMFKPWPFKVPKYAWRKPNGNCISNGKQQQTIPLQAKS
jgi:hypothetical protein